ncbi:hypothetical protein ABN028_20190 [Actinopolymorpha sp. B17G11]|uniref:hypothetical protein n=1 Tax=Actinopolymorpha sp. B17G11 TaxID=3160861 RepID=UPI0032E4B56D
MRHNRRPVLRASNLNPNLISLHPGERPSAACPDCGRWRILRRGMLSAHRGTDGASRCPGSGQRIAVDVTPAQWLVQLQVAARHALQLHAPYSRLRTRPKPHPPVPLPPFRMPAA